MSTALQLDHAPTEAAQAPTEVPYRIDRPLPIAAARSASHDEEVQIAGRIVGRRDHRSVVFLDVADATGRIQVLAEADRCGALGDLAALPVGSWIAAAGRMGASRRGADALLATSWQLLARCEVPWVDPRRGMTDPDARYRNRWLDLWADPDASERFRARSLILSATRRFLEDRDFVEVETPILSDIASGASARPFTTHHNALDTDLYLRVAPELHLKRLVVGGFERVFEIGRVFRNEGLSPRHNPEFTILEAYQAFGDLGDMLELTEALVLHLCDLVVGDRLVCVEGRQLDLSGPWRRASMAALVSEAYGAELRHDSPRADLEAAAARDGVAVEPGWGGGRILAELFDARVERSLWAPTFVVDYPREISPLAREHRSIPGLTERFELFAAGRELANAFTELCDPHEQRRRFEEQARMASGGDEEAMAIDADYLRALLVGLPPTGGLGIGMDRLVMLLTGATTIRDVMLFPTLRPAGRVR